MGLERAWEDQRAGMRRAGARRVDQFRAVRGPRRSLLPRKGFGHDNPRWLRFGPSMALN